MVVAFKDGTARGKTLRLGKSDYLPPGAGLKQQSFAESYWYYANVRIVDKCQQSSVGVKRPGLGVVANNDVSNTARGAGIRRLKKSSRKTDISLYYKQVDMLYMEMVSDLAGKKMISKLLNAVLHVVYLKN